MKRKIVAMLLVTAMAAGMLVGCAGKEPVSNETQTSESVSTEVTTEAEEVSTYNGVDNFQIAKEPIEITVHYTYGASNGAPNEYMPVWQEIAKVTNVKLENTANPSIMDEGQSLSTMLASGELPDIIFGRKENIKSLISQGAIIPLDDLIAEHAPNIQKFLEDYPEMVAAGSGPDGKQYSLGGTLGGESGENLPSQGWFIRMDWLEKLGLDVPTDLESFKNVMYAFRTQDPNGNGVQDEIPLFHRGRRISEYLQLWDVRKDWYVEDDGVIYHGKATEGYKTAIKELAQWYKDGIIDPEIFTRGSQARQELLGTDVGGCTFDWFTSTGSVNDSVREMVPNINFAAIDPPKNVNGNIEVFYARPALHDYTLAISATCEDPETVIKFLDFGYTEVGSRLLNGGIEGVDYTIENGVFTPTEHAVTSHSGGYPNYLRSIGCYEWTCYGNLEGEKISMNKESREGFELYETNAQWLADQFPTLSFNEEEQKIFDANNANINTVINEYEQGVIMGNIDVDSTWDKYMADLNAVGLQELLGAYNSAYQRYLESMK